MTGGVLLFVQQASQRTVVAADRQAVEDARDDLLSLYRSGGAAALRGEMARRFRSVEGERAVLLLTDAAGRPAGGNLGAWPAGLSADGRWRIMSLYRVGRDEPEPTGVIPVRLKNGDRLLTGMVISNSLQLARIYEEALSVAFIMSLVLALGGAIMLGRILARQVSDIAQTANDVAVGALDRRVPTDGSGDAFDRLGASINAMLERIDALVTQLRMMTDGLAHDLKSPVTRLISVVEQASAQTRDDTALDALEKVHQEAQTLRSMLTTALLISRTEAGFGGDLLRDTDVGELLRDVGEVYGPLVEDSGFALTIAAPDALVFPLHRELLSQSLANLIENALHYAEGGDGIALSAALEDGHLLIVVADNGPGIPAESHAAALKRFGRLDPARGKPGSGLGLSLVEAVARLHHGAVTLADNGPGLRVMLSLRRP
ncbi:histidine kinase [Sphingobium chlorophenolicum L-1]|uniref:histidine kinase n=1 Tax=Sphingobium chlorophenolicum L-1 TaxID=690566 RepID=F6EZ55_SPHCR|nr:HAMP domain-containing sensor histidine kinase [Sphingobium chlorophenolicum]AEG50148.1 histidine kinase [Sphingobium chlorophenolicum L-1]